MLHFSNKGFVNAFKLTNYFAGFSYSPSFSLFLFAIILAIIIIEDMIGLLDYYLYSFIVFSYCNSDKKDNSDKESPDELNVDDDEDNEDDDDLYLEPGCKRYTGEEWNFAFCGSLTELPNILHKDFIGKLKTFINSIELKDSHLYYIGIYAEKLEDFDSKYGHVLNADRLNIYSLLIRKESDRINIDYNDTFRNIKDNLYGVIAEYEDHDTAFVLAEGNLFIEFKEIDLLDESKRKLFKALNIYNLNVSNMNRSDFSSEISSHKNKKFNGKRSYSTISNVNTKSTVLDQKSPIFIALKNILNSELSNKDKQIKIEETLLYFWKEEFERMLKTSKVMDSQYSLNLFIKEYKSLEKDFNFFFKDKANLNHKKYLNIISNIEFSLIIYNILSKLIPFLFKYSKIEEQDTTELYKSIGNALLNEHISTVYRNAKSLNSNFPEGVPIEMKNNLLSFKELKDNISKEYSEDDLTFLGLSIITIMEINSSLFSTKEIRIKMPDDKFKTVKYFIPTEILSNLINEIIFTGSEEIPLIAPPIPWEIKDNKITRYGGYYLNDQSLFSPLVRLSHENSMSDTLVNSVIIDSINYMSSIPYSINREVLEILLNDLDILKSISSLHPDTFKIKEFLGESSVKDRKRIEIVTEHNSKYYYLNSILNVAKLMVNVERFYYTFFLDWRGRIYTKSGALNFQSGDLAKSLLKFSNGCVLNEEGLFSLKIYLANLYGKDKLSHDKRIEWVVENEGLILDINSGFWKNADEPYTFLAASIEYKNYLKDPSNFKSCLPILLDATCNGLQHLAAMSKDINLAKKVNLLESNGSYDPEDCYSLMIPPIKDEINKLIESEPIYAKLGTLELKRILIKRPIMTISYGISIRGIQEQLINEHFSRLDYKIDDKIMYKSKEYIGDVLLSGKEIYKLAEIIYKSLFREHPMLNELVCYFKDIVSLLNKLSLPVVWITPTGLEINQKYSEFEAVRLTTKIYGKRKSLIMRKKLQEINKRKQISAFVPNFIHSMDASNVCLLTKSIVDIKQNINILTIHDCFGTSANDAPNMLYLVKNAFIQIYAKSEFLIEFHNFILEYLEKNNCTISSDKTMLYQQGVRHSIPTLPKLGNFNFKEKILNSLYFIN